VQSDHLLNHRKEFSTLAMNMTNREVIYHAIQDILDEVISSGKLSIFSNHTLNFTLSSNKRVLSRTKFREDEHRVIIRNGIAINNTEGYATKMIINAQDDIFNIKEI